MAILAAAAENGGQSSVGGEGPRQDKTPKPLKEGSTQKYKVPKIQRLITPAILQRRRHLAAIKRRCQEKSWQQDLGTETEGAERAEGAAEKEVRFPESEQDIRLQ